MRDRFIMITILIPVHDRNVFLSECIESAINQKTDQEYDILVVKNGNSDEVNNTLAGYENQIRIIEKDSKNLAEKLNFGIEQANGEWIKYLSSDDMLKPNCIETYSKCLDKSKYYYSYFSYINESNITTNTYPSISLVSGFFHKDFWERIGKFNPQAKYEDTDFTDRIPKEDRILINKVTACYRVHSKQGSALH